MQQYGGFGYQNQSLGGGMYNNVFDYNMQANFNSGVMYSQNPFNQYSPFSNGFNYSPMGFDMWTNPAIMW